MSRGLGTYLDTIHGSSIGTSDISSIIKMPFPYDEFAGLIIH